MKKYYLLLIALMGFTFGMAQSNKEEVDLFQAAFGKEKKAIVADFIKLEGTQKEAFWKLYDEYETSRKALGKQRIALLEKYVNNYPTLDDATTDEIIKEIQSLGGKTDKLIVTYYGKIKKSAGSKPAAQFYQLEGYLLSVIRSLIMEQIPMIGEWEKD